MNDDEVSFRARAAESVRLVGLAARMVWRVGPWLLIGLTFLLVLQAVIPTAQLQFTRHAVDALTRAARPLGSAGGGATAMVWFGLLTAALLATVLIGPVASLIQAMIGDRLAARIGRAILIACNSWQGVARFEDPSFADDLSIARSRTNSALDVVSYTSRAAVTLATTIGIAVTLGGLHPLVPIVLIAAHLPGVPFGWQYAHRTGSLLYVLTPKARRLEYLRDLSGAAEQAKDVRLADVHRYLRRRYARDWTASVGEVQGGRRRMIRPVLVADLISGLALAGSFGYLVRATADGRVGIGGLVMFSAAAIMLGQNLTLLSFELGFLPMPLSFLRPVDRVLRAGPDLAPTADAAPVPDVITEGIAFEDVHFGYPDGPEILRGVTFTLHPGESLAPGRRQRRRQDHGDQTAAPAVRPRRRPDHPRRHRPARLRP